MYVFVFVLFVSNYPANDVGNNFKYTNKIACETRGVCVTIVMLA